MHINFAAYKSQNHLLPSIFQQVNCFILVLNSLHCKGYMQAKVSVAFILFHFRPIQTYPDSPGTGTPEIRIQYGLQ